MVGRNTDTLGNTSTVGGKYISSGTYGCTFLPNLKCARSRNLPAGTIGKIFRDSYSFKDEERLDKFIRKLDPENKFTPKFHGSCKTDLMKARVEDELQRCNLVTDPNIKQGQLLFDFAGRPLDKVLVDGTVAIDDFIPAMYSIFEGLKILQEHKYCHSDIKPDNVLYHKDHKKMYMIDFGMLVKMNKVHYEYSALVHNYQYYPPEMKLLGLSPSIKTFDFDYIKNFIEQNFHEVSKETLYSSVPGFERKLDYTIRKAMITPYRKFEREFTTKYVKKLDSYSLAMSFVECYRLGQIRKPTIVNAFLQDIMYPAIDPDPDTRIGIEEILSRYTTFTKKYKVKLPIAVNTVYEKDISKCNRSEAKGGYGIKELRDIARAAGIVATKRKDICEQLVSLQKK